MWSIRDNRLRMSFGSGDGTRRRTRRTDTVCSGRRENTHQNATVELAGRQESPALREDDRRAVNQVDVLTANTLNV